MKPKKLEFIAVRINSVLNNHSLSFLFRYSKTKNQNNLNVFVCKIHKSQMRHRELINYALQSRLILPPPTTHHSPRGCSKIITNEKETTRETREGKREMMNGYWREGGGKFDKLLSTHIKSHFNQDTRLIANNR